MGYFNYFLKCIIRRFVRLFFTKKTFIIILIFISLFVFLRTEGYCASDLLMNAVVYSFFTDNTSALSPSIIPDLNITNLHSYRVYEMLPGKSYRISYSQPTVRLSYINSLDFTSVFGRSFFNQSGSSNFNYSGTVVGSSGGSFSGSGSVNSFSGSGTNTDNSYVTFYTITFASNFIFTVGVSYFLLVPTEIANDFNLYMVDEVSSSDITTQTNTIKDSSVATQNTIKDSSQQMQNTIKDSNVTVETDLPHDNTTDITESGFNSIFTIVRNTFTSSNTQDLVLTIPFTGKSFTINFANVYRWF